MAQSSRKHVYTLAADLDAEQELFLSRAINTVTGHLLNHYQELPGTFITEAGSRITPEQAASHVDKDQRITVRGVIGQETYMDAFSLSGRNFDYDHFDAVHNRLLSFGVPNDPEVQIIGIEGSMFHVEYSTCVDLAHPDYY